MTLEAHMHILLPDGQRARLSDWSHTSAWTTTTHIVWVDGVPMVQLGYTLRQRQGGDVEGDVPAPISLDAFAERVGISAWALRCAVREEAALDRGEGARDGPRQLADRALASP